MTDLIGPCCKSSNRKHGLSLHFRYPNDAGQIDLQVHAAIFSQAHAAVCRQVKSPQKALLSWSHGLHSERRPADWMALANLTAETQHCPFDDHKSANVMPLTRFDGSARSNYLAPIDTTATVHY